MKLAKECCPGKRLPDLWTITDVARKQTHNLLPKNVYLVGTYMYRVFYSEMRETKALDWHLKLNFDL